MEWIQEHWVGILAVVGGLHAIAKVVVSWTETKADDKILASITSVMRVIGLQPKGKS